MQGEDDKGGFHPHPGDPWHPGWTTDTDDDAHLVVDLTGEPDALDSEDLLEDAIAHFTDDGSSVVIDLEAGPDLADRDTIDAVIPLREDAAPTLSMLRNFVDELNLTSAGQLQTATAAELARFAAELEIARSTEIAAELAAWSAREARHSAGAAAAATTETLVAVDSAAEAGRLEEAKVAAAAAVRVWSEWDSFRQQSISQLEFTRADAQIERERSKVVGADTSIWATRRSAAAASRDLAVADAETRRADAAVASAADAEILSWLTPWLTAAHDELGTASLGAERAEERRWQQEIERATSGAIGGELAAWANEHSDRATAAVQRLAAEALLAAAAAGEAGRLDEARAAGRATEMVWGDWESFRQSALSALETTRADAQIERERSLVIHAGTVTWAMERRAAASERDMSIAAEESRRADAAVAAAGDAEIAAWVRPAVAGLCDEAAKVASLVAGREELRRRDQIERANASEASAAIASYAARRRDDDTAVTAGLAAGEHNRCVAQLALAANAHARSLVGPVLHAGLDASTADETEAETARLTSQLERVKADAAADRLGETTQVLTAQWLVDDGVQRNAELKRLDLAVAKARSQDVDLLAAAIQDRLGHDSTRAAVQSDEAFETALAAQLRELAAVIIELRAATGAFDESPPLASEVAESSRPWWKRIVGRRRRMALAPITGGDDPNAVPAPPGNVLEEPETVERDSPEAADGGELTNELPVEDARDEETAASFLGERGPEEPADDTPTVESDGSREDESPRSGDDHGPAATGPQDQAEDESTGSPDADDEDDADADDDADDEGDEVEVGEERELRPVADSVGAGSPDETTAEPDEATAEPDEAAPDDESVEDTSDERAGDAESSSPEAPDLLEELDEWTDPGWGLAGAPEMDESDGQIEFDWEADAVSDIPDFAQFTPHEYVQTSTQEYAGLAEAVAQAATEEHELSAVAAEIPGLESGMLDFDDVVAATGAEGPAVVAPRRSDLALRIATGLGLLALFVASMAFSWSLGLLILVVLMVAAGEFSLALVKGRYHPLTLFGLAGTAGVLISTWLWGPVALPVAVMLTIFAVVLFYALVPRTAPLVNSAVTLLVVLWVGVLGSFAFLIIDSPDFRWLIAAVVVTVAVMDVAQFFVGRRFGKHALAPVVSPRKTVEGLLGGIVVAVGAGYLWGFAPPLDHGVGVLLGLAIAASGPFGDLGVSVAKRSLGVKDMGTILPGHGGVLDRIDAMLVTLPLAWIVYTWAGLL